MALSRREPPARSRSEHKRHWQGRASGKEMEDEDRPKLHFVKRHISRTRLVMSLLLIVAMAIFVTLANRAVHENADAIRQVFGQ